MKKILLTTTALVASAGFAMADVTVSGSADMGIKHSDSTGDKTNWESDVDINVNASGETDGGISWTANAGFGNDTGTTQAGISTGTADNGKVTISGEFGTIGVGAVSSAGSNTGMADVGYDGIGVDDIAETGRAQDDPDVSWSYAMDGIALTVSTNSHSDNTSASVGWTSGALAITVAQSATGGTAGATKVSNTSMSVSTSVGGLAIGFMGSSNSVTATGTSTGMTASLPVEGLGTVTFAVADTDASTDASYGIGFSKALGGGATLAGAYGSVNNVSKADLGISFSF